MQAQSNTIVENEYAAFLGLHCGQHCHELSFIRNCGWYLENGTKIGFGDLSLTDFKRIAAKLAPFDIFLVLPESASFFNGFYGDFKNHPGPGYVAEYAVYAITPGKVFRIFNDDEKREFTVVDGIELRPLSRHALRRRLTAGGQFVHVSWE